MLARLARLEELQTQALSGGGERYTKRHHERGKLLARERIELLLDADAPFLELSPLAAAETEYLVGASIVTGVGVVEGTECLILASDPTALGGSVNPYTLAKMLRAYEISLENRLPLVFLVESGGADLPRQSEVFLPGGAMFRNLTRASAARVPTISLVFGNSTAGRRLSARHVGLRGDGEGARQGVPRRPAPREDGDRRGVERRGAGRRRDARAGLGPRGPDGRRRARRAAPRSPHRGAPRLAEARPRPVRPASCEPLYDPEELLGIASADLKVPFPIREVIARLVDGSAFDEFKPLYGTNLVTGWARLHGFDLGILANDQGVLFSEEAQKAAQFIQLANKIDVPLLFLQNVTGYMVGKKYEQGGIIKHGSLMVNAVSNSAVPHLTLQVGGSYGAGNYGMSGFAYKPRFLFLWPNAKTAVMGPEQLAGTLSIVARQAAAAAGRPFDEEADTKRRAADRGADRARVAGALHERADVRRRHPRPARQPHRARSRALRGPLERDRRLPRVRRVPDVRRRCASS